MRGVNHARHCRQGQLICYAVRALFRRNAQDVPRGVKEQSPLFARLPLTFGSRPASPWARSGPPEYTSQTQVKLSVEKSQQQR